MTGSVVLASLAAVAEDSPVPEDDIGALQHYLGAAPVQYVDVAMARAHRQVLKCWPLLHEMDANA